MTTAHEYSHELAGLLRQTCWEGEPVEATAFDQAPLPPDGDGVIVDLPNGEAFYLTVSVRPAVVLPEVGQYCPDCGFSLGHARECPRRTD